MHHISTTLKMVYEQPLHFGSHFNSQMYSVGGDVLSAFTETIFQSVFLVAYEITFTHLNIHYSFLWRACACVTLLPFQ